MQQIVQFGEVFTFQLIPLGDGRFQNLVIFVQGVQSFTGGRGVGAFDRSRELGEGPTEIVETGLVGIEASAASVSALELERQGRSGDRRVVPHES